MTDQGSRETLEAGSGFISERINRQTTYTDVLGCLRAYNAEQKNIGLVQSVWNEKNRLFSGLPREVENKMFHDENHTNRTVTFVSWGLQAAKREGMEISLAEAQSLIIAAISHDWGYLKEEGETIGADFSKTAGGHEERSKIQIGQFLRDKAETGEIEQVQRFIDWTKVNKGIAGLTFESERGLMLRFADLCAGGITMESDSLYNEYMDKLAWEFEEGGINAFESNAYLKAALTKNGRYYFADVASEIEPFIQLMATRGEKYDLHQTIGKRMTKTQGLQ